MPTRAAFAVLISVVIAVQPTMSHTAHAQSARAVTLGKPIIELNDTFTAISSIRELADGRVIISDSRDKLVQLADFRTQKLIRIGRDGSGPGEYKTPGKLYALRSDTTLLQDIANNRYLIINPDGKAGAIRSDNLGPFAYSSEIGLDERGATFLSVRAKDSKGETGTQFVVRYDPRTKHADTLTTVVYPAGLNAGASRLGNGMLKFFTNLPFAPQDVAAVARDGRVAIARFDHYHVDWFTLDGKKTVGPEVKYTPIDINSAEKRAFLEKQVRPGSIIVQNNSAATSAPIAPGPRKALYSAETYDDEGMTWPQQEPPFLGNAVSIDGIGRAWVLRTSPHTAAGLSYDVFDAAAKLVFTVTLPPKTKVVGFGTRSVYLAFTDEDDLQHLHRYTAPQ